MDVRLGAELAAKVSVLLSVVAFVGEHGADTGHHREGGKEQPLEGERVVDVGHGGSAGHRRGENNLLFLLGEVLHGGVDGVELITIDNDSLALGLMNVGGVTDIAVVDRVAGVVEDLALGFVGAGNGRPEFGFFDPAEEKSFVVAGAEAVGATGEFADIVGDGFERVDLAALFGEVLEGSGADGAELISLDYDSAILELTGAGDILAVDNVSGILADIYR